jgi:hypothetical protein
MTTKYIEKTVEVDLDDFETEDLFEALHDRGAGKVEHEHLLRHGIEDRDWSKIEEFAEKLDVHFSRKP